MYEKKQILTYLLRNKPSFLQKYHLIKVGIFGSYARNEQRYDSDLDLMVEFEQNTPNLSRIKEELRNEIQQELHISVDICREKYVKPIFRKQILAETEYV
ncbi:nucleotidyltransferase [Bacteroidia bacterium]|nr:nucleotidyltransferase [Bacteroidia bacterium]